MSAPSKPLVALISGHIDLTDEDFKKHYIPKLDTALAAGHNFLMGDAPGADSQARAYLLSSPVLSRYGQGVRSRITVCPARPHKIPQLLSQGVNFIHPDDPSLHALQTICVVKKEGRDTRRYSLIQRDANMTAASDYDILYYRSEAESRLLYGAKYRNRISATELNWRRRAEIKRLKEAAEQKTVADSAAGPFTVATPPIITQASPLLSSSIVPGMSQPTAPAKAQNSTKATSTWASIAAGPAPR